MLVRRHRGSPSDYVMRYDSRGRVEDEGMGLSFVYLPRISSVVSVPMRSLDASFRFDARTSDLQPVEVGGEMTYRISRPRLAASALDFSTGPGNEATVEGSLALLRKRMMAVARNLVRDEIKRLRTVDMLSASDGMGRSLTVRMAHSRFLRAMGLSVMNVTINTVKTPPELTRVIEEENMERAALLSSHVQGESFLMNAQGRANDRVSDRGPDSRGRAAYCVECSDSCPFRDVCRDYMANIVDGVPKCTLFRGFST